MRAAQLPPCDTLGVLVSKPSFSRLRMLGPADTYSEDCIGQGDKVVDTKVLSMLVDNTPKATMPAGPQAGDRTLFVLSKELVPELVRSGARLASCVRLDMLPDALALRRPWPPYALSDSNKSHNASVISLSHSAMATAGSLSSCQGRRCRSCRTRDVALQ